MVVLEDPGEERDFLGVLKMAKVLHKIVTPCAFAMVPNSTEGSMKLAVEAVEKFTFNSVFALTEGGVGDIQARMAPIGPMNFVSPAERDTQKVYDFYG